MKAEVVSWRGEGPAMLMPHPSGRLVPLNPYSDGETPQDSIESVIVRRGSARRFSHESITLRSCRRCSKRPRRAYRQTF